MQLLRLLGQIVVVLCATAVVSSEAFAKRTISGTVTLSDGRPAVGYRVKAWDDDTGSDDDELGRDTTNASGRYKIRYEDKGWDGPATDVTTSWRPDVYVTVEKKKSGGGWHRVGQSGVHSDHKLRDDIEIDLKVVPEGQCPVPAKFSTTGTWKGCDCPDSTHKRMLDLVKSKARCAKGESEKHECEEKRGYTWVGRDNDHGSCLKAANLIAMHRQAYYEYFQYVRKGVKLHPLPQWFIREFQQYYKNVDLNDVRIGESGRTIQKGTAMTDCKHIYFSKGDYLESVLNNRVRGAYLLFHEVEHANQCAGLDPTGFSSRRDKYADMWFGQLSKTTVVEILSGNLPSSNELHDKMPMEEQASAQATELVKIK